MNRKKQNIYKKNVFIYGIIITIMILFTYSSGIAEANEISGKSYTVKAGSKPINSKYTKYSTYNKYTKQYYMLRSYLERLEKDGKGTLTLMAGTYQISNTLYVPSNVTIQLSDGVIIKKIGKTGTGKLQSSKCIFTLAAPSKSAINGVYGEYNGETNINFYGQGKAVIDLNFDKGCLGITIGHNTNVQVSGITFQNMNTGHFIEMDASKNVTVENNSFMHHKASDNGNKEAINIDTPDKKTGGFHAIWSNYDCTPDKDIVIQNNSFEDLERAIGTHKYSEGKYHDNVQILNNQITNTSSDAIRILNWTNPVIKGNVIKDVADGKGNKRAILMSGVTNPVVTENTFSDVSRPIQIMPWKNTGDDSNYAITYNDVSSDNISLMLKNTLFHVEENFIRVNKSYNNYYSDTEKYYF